MSDGVSERRWHCHGEQEDYHHIEEAVRVYLHASTDGGRWVICGTTIDGSPLFSDYDEALDESCECGDKQACKAWRDRLGKLDMPNAEELMRMLADSLGYQLNPRQASGEAT